MMLVLLYLLNQICWLEFRVGFKIFMHLYGTVIPSITSTFRGLNSSFEPGYLSFFMRQTLELPCHGDRPTPGPELGHRLLAEVGPLQALLQLLLSLPELGQVQRRDLLGLLNLLLVVAYLTRKNVGILLNLTLHWFLLPVAATCQPNPASAQRSSCPRPPCRCTP